MQVKGNENPRQLRLTNKLTITTGRLIGYFYNNYVAWIYFYVLIPLNAHFSYQKTGLRAVLSKILHQDVTIYL